MAIPSRNSIEAIPDFELASQELRILHHINETVNCSLELDTVLGEIVNLVMEVIPADACRIYLLDETRDLLILRASSNPKTRLTDKVVMRAGEGQMEWAEPKSVPRRNNVVVSDRFGVFPEVHKDSAQAFVSVPIMTPTRRLVGVIKVRPRPPHRYSERETALLSIIGNHVACSIENASLYRKTKSMATKLETINRKLHGFAFTDGLTGLFNHRYFHETLDRELVRAARYRHPMALVLFDVDHFKEVNDTHGHLCGDSVLEAIAKRVLESSRDTDIVSRYGGEEFAMLLPETDGVGATTKAETCRATIEATETRIDDNTVICVTVSLGIAIYRPGQPVDKNALISAADAALYQSKRAGRNRITIAASD